MKKLFVISIVLSLVFIAVPFFLLSFEIETGKESSSIVQQTYNYDCEEENETEYNEVYKNEQNGQDNISYDKYNYETN